MDKLLTAGLGALNMTRKKADDIFQDLLRRGAAERSHRPAFVKDMLDAAQKTRKDLECLVEKQVRQAMDKLDLASKQDLHRLEKKLDQLLAKGRRTSR